MSACGTRASASRSAGPSASTRPSSSRSPTWRPARYDGAGLAWYAAASRLAAGQPFKKEAAIAKLIASNAAMDNARAATQIFGGYGFMNEYPVARFYRDAKILEIGEGTSEVQRMIIARQLGLPGQARASA